MTVGRGWHDEGRGPEPRKAGGLESWERQALGFSPRGSRRSQPLRHCDFSPRNWLQENKSVLFSDPKFGVVPYSSHRKWILAAFVFIPFYGHLPTLGLFGYPIVGLIRHSSLVLIKPISWWILHPFLVGPGWRQAGQPSVPWPGVQVNPRFHYRAKSAPVLTAGIATVIKASTLSLVSAGSSSGSKLQFLNPGDKTRRISILCGLYRRGFKPKPEVCRGETDFAEPKPSPCPGLYQTGPDSGD